MIEKIIDIQEEIKTLIHKNEETYRINPKRVISDFRREKGTTDDYRGRQLLELLQNADDAKTNKVGIHLDSQNGILSVANNGDKFDLGGIQSLLIADLSSKNKREFIGNKGLGFRSILNWTSEINVKTKEFVLTFSPELAKERFEEFFPDNNEQQSILKENKKYLSDGQVPLAILALPKYKKGNSDQEWETIIELKYHKEFELEIIEQLKRIEPRILLFLNYINEIEISGIDDSNTSYKRRFLKESKTEIEINDRQWHIFDSGELLYPDSDDKYYQFKIAWQDDLSDEDSTFFTYFPTEVDTQLPFLIHATFELNQSRNDLLKGPENQFLLYEIAKAIGEIALTRIRNIDKSDWKAFQFLQPINYNNNPKLIAFFEKLLELQNTLEIYPCVDGSYCVLEEAVFYNDEFSNWVRRNHVEDDFTELLIPLEDNELPKDDFRYYTHEGWLEIIKNIHNKIESLHERAILIKLLTGYKFREIQNSKIKLPLLIDKKGNPISENTQVFTLTKAHIEQYKIPDYVDIAFMYGELYEELLKVLNDEVEDIWNGTEDKSRPLKRVVGDVVNMGSSDITEVIRNIVTTSDKQMKDAEGEDRNDIAIGLVESLFSIYQVKPERRNSINLNIPLLNKNLDLCLARDLYLGSEYELGQPTSIIFKGIFSDKDFVAGNEFWQLKEGGYRYLENFFSWLGVNFITKTNKISEYIDRHEKDEYSEFVFSSTEWPKNKVHKEYNVLEISDFKKISTSPNFSLEVLIAWLISDPQIYRQLSFDNPDLFSYSYHNNVTPLNNKPSYIYYQIKEYYLKLMEVKIIVDLDFAEELGYSSIDFEHRVFKDLNISQQEIINVLERLHICVPFSDLEPEDIYAIIQKVGVVELEPKNARKVYKLAFNYFRNKNDFDFSGYEKEFKLLATKKGQKKYKKVSKVYYSDNSTLPSKVSDEFWIFDFPKRLGESQISSFFGVRTFKDVEIRIIQNSIKLSNVLGDFNRWFDRIKPFILTYRIRPIKKYSDQKEEADLLKKVEITLVESLVYDLKTGQNKNLLPGEFLPKANNKGYYLCVGENTTLDILKETPKVCEAFAEILCTLFKVNEGKDDYRAVFKDKDNLKDTDYLITVKSLGDKHKIALELLGISNEEIAFWSKVYSLKDNLLSGSIQSETELFKQVLDDFNIDILKFNSKIDYQDFDSEESILLLREIHNNLDIAIEDLLGSNSNGLFNYHKKTFENVVYDNKKFFNSILWTHLHNNLEQQKHLIELQDKYEAIASSDVIHNLCYENRFTLQLDYSGMLKNIVANDFNLQLMEVKQKDITILHDYKEILLKYNLSDIDIEDTEVRSLLYFEGNSENLKTYLQIDSEEGKESEVKERKEKPTGKLIFSHTTKVIPTTSSNSAVRRGGGNHNNKNTNRKNKAGRKAEELVYNSLLNSEEVIDVEWVSGYSTTSDKSDQKHYDIRYKPINSNNWKYLEVKSFNGSYFHLSKDEKEEAIKKAKHYEIALVIGEEIHILKDLFLEEIDFDNNDKFYATASDYLIRLKIAKENN